MCASIKVGRRLPFRARQLLAPTIGTEARVAGVISGSDRCVNGVGGMDWTLLHAARLVPVEGDDVAPAKRAAGESIWVPTALVDTPDAARAAPDDRHISVELHTDGHRVVVDDEIDAEGRLRSSHFRRGGAPDRTGEWGVHPFGVEMTSCGMFDGVVLPIRGRAGWHSGRPLGGRSVPPVRDHRLRTRDEGLP